MWEETTATLGRMGLTTDRVIELVENVAATRADVRHMTRTLEQSLEAHEKLAGRVAALEKGRTKDLATATGFSAGVSGLLFVLKEKILALLLVLGVLLLSGCPGGFPRPSERGKWMPGARPVDVLIDESMPEACIEATHGALEFWAQHVDYLEPRMVDPKHPAVIGVGLGAHIAITKQKLSPGVAGQTSLVRLGQYLRRALVEIDNCATITVAHELGHALGLKDSFVEGHLMCWTVGCSDFVLLEEDAEWVR